MAAVVKMPMYQTFDNDPGQTIDPNQPLVNRNENTNDNDNDDDSKTTTTTTTIDCKESGLNDGVAGIINQATIRHCDVFGSIGDYTGGWFNGCMKINGGTANSVELCAKELAAKLSGVTVRRE